MVDITYSNVDEEMAFIQNKCLNNSYQKGCIKANDVVLPVYYKKFEKCIEDMDIRDDDIWVCSFMKAGTTWCQEMTWCIANDLDFNGAKQNLFERFPFLDLLMINNLNEKPVDNINTHHSQGDIPCRSCTDFRTFSRMRRQEFSQSQVQSLNTQSKDNKDETKILEHQRDDCPLDKDELGRSTWKLLHTIAATYSDEPSQEDQSNMEQFIRLIPKVYPCEVCANDFSEILTYHPPNISSQKSFAKWMCEAHNMVNRKLEKPLFDCSNVNERWRDGWADGHCD